VMLNRELTNEQLLADIRGWLERGYTAATAERVKAIAARTSDVELLRGMADALADAFINPKPKKTGRPKKYAPTFDGVIDLDEIPPMTSREKNAAIVEFVKTMGIVWDIHDTNAKKGTSIRILCERKGIGVDTYYKWFPVDS